MKLLNGLLLAGLLATVGCSSAPVASEKANVTVANTANVQTNSSAASETAGAQTVAPDTIVKDLYKQHDAQKSPFFQTKNRALVDKYFAKNLADLIWKDAKESDGEVGALGADPLYNAQDTDIKRFSVGEPKINGDRAEVIASFDNFNQKQTFTYTLVKQNNEWKISDINYGDGMTLVKLFKDNQRAMSNSNGNSGEFEGKFQVGDTTCTVKPVKMGFEVRWEKGSGVEMFFAEGRADDREIFASQPESGKSNSFAFADEKYNSGTFYRADGREFPVNRF